MAESASSVNGLRSGRSSPPRERLGNASERQQTAMKGHSRVLSFRHSGVDSKPKPAIPLFLNGAALMLGQCGRSVIGVVGAG